MVSSKDKKSSLYQRILTILYGTLPPADKLRLILDLCNEEDDEEVDE